MDTFQTPEDRCPVEYPLLPVPQQILEKYRGTCSDDRVLPVPSNQADNRIYARIANEKVNRDIDELAPKLGSLENVFVQTTENDIKTLENKAKTTKSNITDKEK